MYNARPSVGGGGGRRREIGRFRVRPSKEAEQFLGEMIQALSAIGPTTMLTRESVAALRARLSPSSPYRERPDLSLQRLGFIDSQRRLLPKALTYVPELERSPQALPRRFQGRVKAAKPGRYGFITDDDGNDYFFHIKDFRDYIEWDEIEPDIRVSFLPGPPKSPGLLEKACEIMLN